MELFLKQNKSVVPRVIQACVECKRRKGKCVGNPCTHCISKRIVCVFPEAKKRGPKFKNQITTKSNDQAHGFQFMHNIQLNLNNLYQQTNLIDFYFEFLGIFVPMGFKNELMAPARNEAVKAQLYLIFAHIVMMFGNKELEQQFITEAQKYVNIFTECNTVESAVSMLMMCLYLGHRNNRSPIYAGISYNITKLPNVTNTLDVHKVGLVASALSMDHSHPPRERMAHVFTDVLPLSPIGLTPHEWVLCCITKVKFFAYIVLELDMDPSLFLASYLSRPLLEDQKAALLEQARVVTELGEDNSDNLKIRVFAKHIAPLIKCLVAWKIGDLQEALENGIKAASVFKEHSSSIVIWHHEAVEIVILLPLFMKLVGQTELYEELMTITNREYSKVFMYKEYLEKCEKLQLHIPANYKFTEIEQELLGDEMHATSSDPPLPSNLSHSLPLTPLTPLTPLSPLSPFNPLDSIDPLLNPLATLNALSNHFNNTNNFNNNNFNNFNYINNTNNDPLGESLVDLDIDTSHILSYSLDGIPPP